MKSRIVLSVSLAVVAALLPTQFAGAERAALPGHDDTLRTSPDGFRYYVDPAPELSGPEQADRVARPVAAAAPLNQTFRLHSLASSPRKLYLDFNGYTIPSGGDWSGAAAGPVSGFNLEGSASTFTAAELTRIQEIWRIVAEKYAPFNLDVTTQDPGTAGLQRASASDNAFGVRMIVTSDPRPRSQGCGGCAGQAYLGVFDDPNANHIRHAWVYASATSGIGVATANVIAHEAGHTFGLHHDGKSGLIGGTDYYGGHENWIPIMGLSTNGVALAQFSRGEYANATNTEDDLAIIAAHGAPYRADDYPNTPGTASTLPTDSVYRRTGIIRSAGDVDVFKVNRACTGTLTATARPIGLGGALDIDLKVYGAAANLLGSNNPPSSQHLNSAGDAVPDGVGATVTVSGAAAGAYYVRVDGVGNGTPPANGYTDYGSVGQYTVTISGCPASRPTAAGIGTASSGKRGGAKNAIARWKAPARTGGSPITGYKVIAYQVNAKGKIVKTRVSGLRKPSTRSYTWALPGGRYKFRVVAYNRVGAAPYSRYSRIVLSR
ncbi:fibronectin type III domain-containing protein [Nocardioides marmoriginsengisoli]|nr:fibronectin type III domain-containing protein [Nocardioides marmoriginsengisoli]